MDKYQLIEDLSLIAGFAANGTIAFLCYSAYLKLRIKPLLLISISAFIGVCCFLLSIFCMAPQSGEDSYLAAWWIIIILGIVDVLLYAFGLAGLLKYLLRKSAENPG